MPGVSGVTVVTNARAYYSTRAAAGAPAPGIPCALCIQGGKFTGKPRADRAARMRSRAVFTPLVVPAKRPANGTATNGAVANGGIPEGGGTLAERIRALQSHASRARQQGA